MKRQPGAIVFGDNDMPTPVVPKTIEGVDGQCLYYDRKCDGCLMNCTCNRNHQYEGGDQKNHCKCHGESGIGLSV